jgi:hypothetical protein
MGMNREQEDFAAKLILIEWEANAALEDLPPSTIRDRIQHIATVARLLRLRLDAASSVLPPAPARKINLPRSD